MEAAVAGEMMIQKKKEACTCATGEFEGLALSGKNAGHGHEDDYLSLNKTTGRKKGRGKKKGGLKVNDKIPLFPEAIEIFALLDVEPPSTLNAVADAMKSLIDKRTWFSTLKRGVVPSIREKQKADEAKQQSKSVRSEKVTASKSQVQARDNKSKGFNAAGLSVLDDAFPSLPCAVAASVKSNKVRTSQGE